MNRIKKRFGSFPLPERELAVRDSASRKFPRIAVISLVIGAATALALAVGASSTLLQGRLTVTENQSESKTSNAVPESATRSTVHATSQSSELVEKYGMSAKSPAVATAIKKAEGAVGIKKVEWALGAKAAADRAEALEHGYWKPGADPMLAIMYGYIPPGMSQEQAAMLYKSMPHLPRMPESIGIDSADKYAGGPDVADGLPEELSGANVEHANQAQLEKYIREKSGPIYIPPLHRDHNWLAQHTRKIADDFVMQKDNQMSPIPAQYGYDGGSGPRSIREMTDASGNIVSQYAYDPYGRQTRIGGTGPDSDFGYAGMYVHQPSKMNLTPHRAYNPALGRWISRDPIQDPAFNLMPQSPEPTTTDPMMAMASQHESPAAAHLNKMLYSNGTLGNIQLPTLVTGQARRASPDGNLYVYVSNNPVNWTDLSGLMMSGSGSGICPASPHEMCRALCQFEPTPEDFIRCYRRCMAGYGL
jgi:RHS repeat-associated protein